MICESRPISCVAYTRLSQLFALSILTRVGVVQLLFGRFMKFIAKLLTLKATTPQCGCIKGCLKQKEEKLPYSKVNIMNTPLVVIVFLLPV